MATDKTESPRYVTQQWTVADGLPVNAVSDVTQTEDGYLWLATFDGLVRFDGAQFTVYQSGNHDGLPSSRILDVEAVGQVVWLRTESQHLVRMARGTFQTIALPNVLTLHVTDDQTVWAGTGDGLFRVEATGSATPVQGAYIQGQISTVHQTPAGDLWVGTSEQGVYHYTKNGALDRFTGGGALSNTRINSIASLNDGTVLIAAWNGVWRWADGEVEAVQSAQGEETGASFLIQKDHAGTHWVSAEQRVYRYEAGVLVRAADHESRSRNQLPGSLIQSDTTGTHEDAVWINAVRRVMHEGQAVLSTSARITQIHQDHEGNVWVTTNGAGIYQLRRSQIRVYGAEEGVGSGNIYPILQRHDGSIWLGSLGGGLTRITSEDTTTVIPQQGASMLEDVWALHETRDSTLWVGGAGLCRWEAGQCAPYKTDTPPDFGRVLAIHEDTAQNLWVGTNRGLYRRTPSTDEGSPLWSRYTPQNSRLPHRIVRVIHESDEGALWVGTNGGGVAIYQEDTFYPFSKDEGLPSNLVRDMYQDAAGTFWIATEDRGLLRIEWPEQSATDTAIRNASITTLTTQDGLLANGIHRIIEDDAGRMWMSTNQGLFWADRSELHAVAQGTKDRVATVRYTERDGTRNREANGGMQPAGMRDRQGRIWFPTQAGAAVIDASEVQASRTRPPVHIKRVVTSDSTYHPVNGRVDLATHARSFDVVYTAIGFSDPAQMQFRYQLEGVDDEPKPGGMQRRATYTSIDPGSYAFTVHASNEDGIWNEKGATVTIEVPPHFYETWWFYTLMGIAGVAALGWAYWIRTAALKKREAELERTVQARTEELRREKEKTTDALALAEDQAERLERIDAAKSRFFARISHEFRTPLTLTLGPINNLLEANEISLRPDEHEQLNMARRNATRLAQMVSQLHDLAQLETGTMAVQPEMRDVVAFVSNCIQAFQGLAERRNIALAFEADAESHTFAFDPTKIRKVIAGLIANAFQAAQAGDGIQVVLQTKQTYQSPQTDAAVSSNEAIVLIIEDTGRGMPPAQFQYLRAFFQKEDPEGWSHNDRFIGMGLNLVNELVALHEGTIRLQSRGGEGTTFTIHLPEQHVDDVGATEPAPEEGADASVEVLPNGEPGRSDIGGSSLQLAERVLALEEDRTAPTEEKQTQDDQTTVLIIDDNADFRAYLRWHLDPIYRVVEAENGTEGYKAAQSLLPDIAIADVMMPGMDGLALCQAIKDHPDIDQIPVVFLTAAEEAKTRVQAYEAGGDGYLTKPFNAEELKALIENLVQDRHTLRRDANATPEEQAEQAQDDSASDRAPSSLQSLPFDERLEKTIDAHRSDPEFGVAALAEAMAISTSQLRRKMDAYYERTPVQLIRYRRLQAGAELLNDRADATIGEVAYAVGFNSQSYFSRAFKDAFGAAPSSYRRQQARSDEDNE